MIEITVPYNGWKPRPHQKPLWRYMRTGGKRAIAIWHRRAGKDDVCLHNSMLAAMERPGSYWHCLPEYEQARRAIWTAVNAHTGKRRIDEAFPQELRENTNDSTMFIRFKNGSTWACIGSDNYSATVGAGVAGIVYSEWALANPSAWAYHRPMVEENNGWATFISTPRGRNHALTMYNHALQSPDWFAELLTVEDTGSLSEEILATALKEYVALYGEDQGRGQFLQEYYCDWSSNLPGAFYTRECRTVRQEGRIIALDAIPGEPVNRVWDLGMRDDTSVWWWQMQGGQCVLLDHHASSGGGLEYFEGEIIKRRKQYGWIDGTDFVPTDAKVKEWGTARTRVETMQQLGLKPFVVRQASVQDGINAVRRLLPLCVFHPRTEIGGFEALEQYHREWDDDKKAFRATHVHDWTSHVADSFRYLAMAWQYLPRPEPKAPAIEPGTFIIPMPQEARRGAIRL